MIASKQNINDAYLDTVEQLIRVQEQMLDFMALVEEAKMDGSEKLKRDVISLRLSLYDPIRVFLEDYSMNVTSSEIQNHIDKLENDKEEDEE